METFKEYGLTELTNAEIKSITGGGIFKRFGSWLGEKWNEIKCGCGDPVFQPPYTDYLGQPKW